MALTGNDDGFKYDIAFSFVKEDEGLATQLNDHLRDRYRTFYTLGPRSSWSGRRGKRHSIPSSKRKPESLPCCCDPNGDIPRGDFDSQLAAQDTYLVQP